ncbi:DIS3-like exonuclease 2 isoform X1 [Megalopta genalis]|uniref:DIS3-like exonuclease 2 isoform X1 n=1 Tax=Megalopta genalis TaxID=115081 RepID=UPI003FD060A9
MFKEASSLCPVKNMSRKASVLENCENEKSTIPHCPKKKNENVGQRIKHSLKAKVNGKEGGKVNSCSNAHLQDELQSVLKQKREKACQRRKAQQKSEELKSLRFECNSTKEVVDVEDQNKSKAQKPSKTAKKKDKFSEHVTVKQVRELLKNQNSENAEYVEGHLRINPKFCKYAYLSLSDDEPDLVIIGVIDRNRALDGDLVVVHINPPTMWESENRKTGVVVSILEKIHPRLVVGHLKREGAFLHFYSRDKRTPNLEINQKKDQLMKSSTTIEEDKLYLARISDWIKPKFANGKLVKMIGAAGDISAESNAILLELNLDTTPYNEETTKGLQNKDYSLTEKDINDREDWRNECIFTIDPDTAVDLDDAVSCKPLENGNYEIGVHIADVTYYLEFLSSLDVQVAKRATSIYMTDRVYHMLPKQLCDVCSLLPGQDRLAFSVICEMTPEAKVVKYRFAKTVMNSCCKMSYRHAQIFIEDPENESWPVDMLQISGNYNINNLSSTVNILHRLARKRCDERFANGALDLSQSKLRIKLDKTTGEPINYSMEEHKESNRLIQEFMLLANMIVAKFLYEKIPETALLRNHRKPPMLLLKKMADVLQVFGIHLDIESSGSLHASVKRYGELLSENSDFKTTMKYRMMVINNLCAKTMNRATYTCSSAIKTEVDLRHYALNVCYYTHFTSPIRRYADCVVHRLLYSVIKDEALPPEWSEKKCRQIAKNCNLKKWTAEIAGRRSSELYFAYLVDLSGPFVTKGIVFDIKVTNIGVILCDVGIQLRVYFTNLENLATIEHSVEYSVPMIRISWKKPAVVQVINIFTLLYLTIKKDPVTLQLTGTIVQPH